MHRSSALHCQVPLIHWDGKKNGRSKRSEISIWKCWIYMKAKLLPSQCINEQATRYQQTWLGAGWVLNVSFRTWPWRVSSSKEEMWSTRWKKKFKRSCFSKVWLPWWLNLAPCYYDTLNLALSLVTFHCETNYFCSVASFEGADARRELITFPSAQSAVCDPSLMMFN